MTEYLSRAGLSVSDVLCDFIEREASVAADVDPAALWRGLADLVARTGPQNRDLLAERARLQAEIDAWHRANGPGDDLARYEAFLTHIGYLLPQAEPLAVSTTGVAAEIALLHGPQLVVPATNARYALNAANARWGSLYDALYGTDVVAGVRAPGYDPVRGARVREAARDLLDEFFPLAAGSHRSAAGYRVVDAALEVVLGDGGATTLRDPSALRGYTGPPTDPTGILLRHHGLHVELRIDRDHVIGRDDPAGIRDIHLEAALSAIVDLEDSVATVDAGDKVGAYRNWLGLNSGDLTATFRKDDRTVTRKPAPDRRYTSADGSADVVLPGRSALFVRTVGLHMMTDAVLDADGTPIFEGVLDAIVAVLCAMPSRTASAGAVYVVKPKLHGPAEAAFTRELFAGVESVLGLPPLTVKVGIMDEERRMSLNLEAALGELADRLVFINTGFLDRSGDEIRTSSAAGPMVTRQGMRGTRWIRAYEDRNVDVGLRIGLPGRGQIGKGMWAAPDRMSELVRQKIEHPLAGASTAWVPSPTAATLHAIHYHRVDVAAVRRGIAERALTPRRELLAIPIGGESTPDEVAREVDSCAQSILGYVVRWVELGVGASTIPDLDGTGLMEDRATLRISSQLLANWMQHGVVTPAEVRASLERMAAVVDAQNAREPGYTPMTDALAASPGFLAADELIFTALDQPNGYTEEPLTRWRRVAKQRRASTTKEQRT